MNEDNRAAEGAAAPARIAELATVRELARQTHEAHDLGHRFGAWPVACLACSIAALMDKALDATPAPPAVRDPQTEAEMRKAVTGEGCACGKPFIQHDQHMPVYVWNVLADLLNFEPVARLSGEPVDPAVESVAFDESIDVHLGRVVAAAVREPVDPDPQCRSFYGLGPEPRPRCVGRVGHGWPHHTADHSLSWGEPVDPEPAS